MLSRVVNSRHTLRLTSPETCVPFDLQLSTLNFSPCNSFLSTFFRTLASHFQTSCPSNSFAFNHFRTLCQIPGIGYLPSSNKKGKIMTQNSTKSSSINDLPRCQHRFRSGHQCRLAVSSTVSDLCTKHARARQKQSESPGLAALLTADIGEFKSAYDVHDFLSRLQQLLAEKCISPRHAGVMAYISSLHLRTLAAIQHETDDDAPYRSSSMFRAPSATSTRRGAPARRGGRVPSPIGMIPRKSHDHSSPSPICMRATARRPEGRPLHEPCPAVPLSRHFRSTRTVRTVSF